jgi:predicted ATPase
MLTRLKVRGFKNLIDCDVRFGPFTCIAGPNGVGKSNLFDAILFLSRLADSTLLEAVTNVRGETRSADALRVFSSWPDGREREMSFEAELLVPAQAVDDLGVPARATTTALRYSVTLRATSSARTSLPHITLVHEALDYVKRSDAAAMAPFAQKNGAWLKSTVQGTRKSAFISTDAATRQIKLHEDSGHQGRTRSLLAETLQRTVLSSVNTAESPTALVVRREFQSWRMLQLEPSRLRAPDEMKAQPSLDSSGAGLAATLHRLLGEGDEVARLRRRQHLANRLAELNEDVADLRVDADEKRELLTVMVRTRNGLEFRARDLSDGTLRFLALAILEEDPEWGGLICMEEPENGVHPSRLEAMRRLLTDLAVDVHHPIGPDNPLRQVILNTHSPELVALMAEDALVMASRARGNRASALLLRAPRRSWRGRLAPEKVMSRGELASFVDSMRSSLARAAEDDGEDAPVRIGNTEDLRQMPLSLEASA